MLYREAGQFKSSYAADQQIFPIRQDRIAVGALLIFAFIVVPLVANQYWFSAILTPLLILALATLGLNILTGYAGQLSLGTAAFMAIGAFMTYNFELRIPGMPILVSFALAGLWVGNRIHGRISRAALLRFVAVLLLLMGVSLIVRVTV